MNFTACNWDISNLRGEIRELGPSIRHGSAISDLLLENEFKGKKLMAMKEILTVRPSSGVAAFPAGLWRQRE
ncbi:hypothetical protein [Escherichia coli]|uniref:hypothetical protein n=1 Tax=Escherichia coli TaxID=562 RepID=UPI002FCD6419